MNVTKNMEETTMCRCCLMQGTHKDLNSCYNWMDKKEIYSEMLKECFNINLAKSEHCNSICEGCILNLRNAQSFKHLVLASEEEFLKTVSSVSGDDPNTIFQVKLEPKTDSGDDSDDYFLADRICDNVSIKKIKKEKKETPPKKKQDSKRKSKTVSKKDKKGTEGSWKNEKIKHLVNRLATSIDSCDLQDQKKISKIELKPPRTRKITIVKNLTNSKINLSWSRTSTDKIKHKENLLTVLKYSNATPFKNKSLLGYICAFCESSFPDPVDLKLHTDSIHSKDKLNFKSNFDMTEYNVKIDITDLTCTLCDEKIDNLSILKTHLVTKHDKTIYTDIKDHMLQFKLKKGDCYDCAMCSSTYETFKMLKQHMNKHYCNYTCTECDTSFATKRSLNAHKQTHQDGSHKCDHCEKIFSSRAKKHYHEKMKHLGARNISNCPYCNEPFRSYYQRNQHLVKVHNSEAQYKCNVCNKAYILKSLLMYHIKKSHLMERNCQCTECGYRFFSKKALKAHMIKHTGERIYACEVCHKSYARKYTLREHMRIHANDRRFKCDVCAMTFVQKCSLKSHLLSNHGISMAASDITSS